MVNEVEQTRHSCSSASLMDLENRAEIHGVVLSSYCLLNANEVTDDAISEINMNAKNNHDFFMSENVVVMSSFVGWDGRRSARFRKYFLRR